MNNKKRILLVEDDPNFGIILRDFLKMNEYDVILAKNGMEGFEKFKKFEFNLCILDVMISAISFFGSINILEILFESTSIQNS